MNKKSISNGLGDAFPGLQKRVCKRFSTYYTPTRTARNGISMAVLKVWKHSYIFRGVTDFTKAQEIPKFFPLTGPRFIKNHPLFQVTFQKRPLLPNLRRRCRELMQTFNLYAFLHTCQYNFPKNFGMEHNTRIIAGSILQ